MQEGTVSKSSKVTCLTTYRNKKQKTPDEPHFGTVDPVFEILRWNASLHVHWLLGKHAQTIALIQPNTPLDVLEPIQEEAAKLQDQIDRLCKTYKFTIHTQGTIHTILKE